MSDSQRGLLTKYVVRRRVDPTGRHEDCWYFVLDIRHDGHARVALADYAHSCREDYPRLAADLTERLRSTPYEGDTESALEVSE
jgi:hypothetical protein